jgi:hypothetical protein
MTERRETPPAPAVPPGLCGGCRHSRAVQARGSSVFRLCLRSTGDPNYPRYPPLPMLSCRGFERLDGSGDPAGS